MRDSFIFYRSFFESIKGLDKEIQAELFDAICEFSLNDKTTEIQGIGKSVFILIKPLLEANNKRYANGKKAKRKQNVSKVKATSKQVISKDEGNKDKDVYKDVNDNKEDGLPKGKSKVGEDLVVLVNSKLNRRYRCTDKVRRQWGARIKEGFTLQDVSAAIENAKDSVHHKEHNLDYLTAEFFTRSDIIDKWSNRNATPSKEDDFVVGSKEWADARSLRLKAEGN